MHSLALAALFASANGLGTIARFQGPGCSPPGSVCTGVTPGNCCRAALPGMFPTRARGVTIRPNPETAASIPYKRGNGRYCGEPITSGATFGDLNCYQNSLLGSGLYINCDSTTAKFTLPASGNASEVLERRESRCPNQLRDLSSASNESMVTEFTDEYGNPTDEEGYINAMQRVDDSIDEMGQTYYYLHKQTGIAPEDMVFEEEPLSEQAASLADAHSGVHHCTGEILVSVTQINKCYTAGTGASILLHEQLPSRCVLNVWPSTPDCTGDSTTLAVAQSQPGCYSGTNFDSIRLDCTQLQ